MAKYKGSWIRCLLFFFLLFNCSNPDKNRGKELEKPHKKKSIRSSSVDPLKRNDSATAKKVDSSALEISLVKAGLVNIQAVNSTIKVDLRYSSTNNFVKVDLYGDLKRCYLQQPVAEKLSRAQQLLQERYPGFSLLVFDGVRPVKIQKMLWDTLDVPLKIKHFYVAHPDSGSIHNYGAAVDLSFTDSTGKEADMGTPFDYFGPLAYPIKETLFFKEGKLTEEQVNNRLILRNVMKDAGFTTITTEWWHFNSCSKTRAAENYKIVE